MQRLAWWAAFLTFAAALLAAWGLAVLRDRATVLDAAATRLEATARVLEQHADRAFEAGDRAVRALIEIGRTVDLQDAGEARLFHGQLRRVIADSPQISSAWVLDAQGVTRVESWDHPPRSQGSFAGRDYFRALSAEPGRGLFIGGLQDGGSSGRPRFTLSRALTDPGGGFAGTVVAGVFSEYFAEVYRDAALVPGARLRLVTREGAPLAAWPPEAAAPDAAGPELRAVRDLARYPVRVAISQPLDATLAPWRARTAASGVGVLAVVAAFAGLTLLGLRGARREAEAAARLATANAGLERRVEERTAALKASEAELGSLYDTAPVGLCLLGPDLRFLRINRRLAEINGVAPEAHLGRTVPEVVPGIATAAAALGERVLRSGEPVLGVDIEGETPAQPGIRRHWSESWLPLKDAEGRVTGISVVAEEVTERRRAEMALRAANDRVTELLEGMSDGFVVLDRDFRVVMVNRQAELLDGRRRTELIGRTHWEIWPASVGTQVEAAYRRAMAERVPVAVEYHYVSAAHDVWLDIRAFPTDEGIGVLYRDVSGRKRAEEEIRALLDRTRQLSEYNEVAAREMGHRVMNGLHTLEGLLAMQARKATEPAAREAIGLATQRVRALAVVQRRLFRATRGDATTLDLGDYLRDLGDDLAQSFLAGDRCTLTVEAEPGLRVSAADGSAAAMVVAELVINAGKYAFRDGDRGHVAVRLSRAGQGWRIEVRDDGRGLPPGFDPAASRGLGMRIVQAMARQLGGTLEIEATPPGTGFVLSVPDARTAQLAEAPPA